MMREGVGERSKSAERNDKERLANRPPARSREENDVKTKKPNSKQTSKRYLQTKIENARYEIGNNIINEKMESVFPVTYLLAVFSTPFGLSVVAGVAADMWGHVVDSAVRILQVLSNILCTLVGSGLFGRALLILLTVEASVPGSRPGRWLRLLLLLLLRLLLRSLYRCSRHLEARETRHCKGKALRETLLVWLLSKVLA